MAKKLSPEFVRHIRKPLDGTKEKMHEKCFYIRLPKSIGDKLMALPTPQRTVTLRKLIVDNFHTVDSKSE